MCNVEHCHSMYSINDSAVSPRDLVKRASELGVKNITLTDHGTLLGNLRFMEAGKEFGVNTIPGVEAYCENKTHLILIPKNYDGYRNISYAMRDANQYMAEFLAAEKANGKKKPKGTPIMTDSIIETYFSNNPNVIATSACIQGPIASILLRSRKDKKKAKYNKTLTETRTDHDAYIQAKKLQTKIAEDLREQKKYRTARMKFQKPAHQKKIDKLRQKLNAMSETDPKRADILGKFIDAENDYKDSCRDLPKIEDSISHLEKRKEELRKIIIQTTPNYKKYEKALEGLQDIRIFSDDELYQEALTKILWFKEIFPNFFIEVQYHGIDHEAYVMPLLVRLARETNTPLIAANDAHMLDGSETSVEARRIMRFGYFERAQTVTDADKELYLKSNEELFEVLSKVIDNDAVNEAIDNLSILEECRVILPEGKHYPKVGGNVSIDDLIDRKRQEMITKGTWSEEIEKRISYELNIIKEMGYEDYHLVVEDFCRAGRLMGYVPKDRRSEIPDHYADLEEWTTRNSFNEGVGIGPGRGSAAGSKVCNLLGITNIDPMKYDLLFERFLNPERVSLPDIDTDVATSLRGYLIGYLKWKYGERAVCSIVTENKYGAKGAIKIVGRDRADQLYGHLPSSEATEKKAAYNRKYTYVLSDLIPEGSGETISSHDLEFAEKYGTDSEMSIIWNNAKLVEGKLFTTGVHAGGVIISDNKNVNDYVPLAWNDEKGVWVAQCDMVQAEKTIGLLKMDLLGLGTLDCINDTLYLIKKYRGISIDINNIEFESEVFESIYAKGFTNSVFQFESSGMKNMLTQFKPTCFEDIILLVAAYRPGPMQYLDDVIAIKNGEKQLTYKHTMLEPILSTTYGATIYQEQVMRIFQDLAGYSLGGADMVRRAMSKKKMKELTKERTDFIFGNKNRKISGCINRGVESSIADTLFDEMMDFALYAFNKSHAAAYAYVSYQTAWLKYHYPAEFLCAMFNNKEQKDYGPIINDCAEKGIKLLPPNVNNSFYDFVLEGKDIRFGVRGIKGIGSTVFPLITRICDERNHGGYSSIHDFLKRNLIIDEFTATIIPNKVLSSFINAGMFDIMKYNRQELDELFNDKLTVKSSDMISPSSLKSNICAKIDKIEIEENQVDEDYNITQEIELLGSIVSLRPLDQYADDAVYGCTRIDEMGNDEKVNIMGFVSNFTFKKSRSGKDMIVVSIEGKSGSCTGYITGWKVEQCSKKIRMLSHKVVRITGHSKEGKTIFISSINRLSPDIRPQFIIPQSFSEVQKIKETKQSDGYIPTYTLHSWNKDGECFDIKVLSCQSFSSDEMSRLKNFTLIRNDIY